MVLRILKLFEIMNNQNMTGGCPDFFWTCPDLNIPSFGDKLGSDLPVSRLLFFNSLSLPGETDEEK